MNPKKSTPLPQSFSGTILIDEKNDRLIAYGAGNIKQLVAGKLFDGSFGFQVSETGVDVEDATLDQLIFNSNQDVFKIVDSGDITVTRAPGADTGINSVSYSDLGFIPAFLAFSESTPLPEIDVDMGPGATAGLIQQMVSAQINTFTQEIDFTIQCPNYSGNSAHAFGSSALIHYYLLQETAN